MDLIARPSGASQPWLHKIHRKSMMIGPKLAREFVLVETFNLVCELTRR